MTPACSAYIGVLRLTVHALFYSSISCGPCGHVCVLWRLQHTFCRCADTEDCRYFPVVDFATGTPAKGSWWKGPRYYAKLSFSPIKLSKGFENCWKRVLTRARACTRLSPVSLSLGQRESLESGHCRPLQKIGKVYCHKVVWKVLMSVTKIS